MATVSLSTTPTTLDDGTGSLVFVTNTGTVDVYLSRGGRLKPAQSATVYPDGLAVTAVTLNGAGSVTTTTTAKAPSQADIFLTKVDATATYLTQVAATATYAKKVTLPSVVGAENGSNPTRIVTLAGCQDDETINNYFSTLTDDTTNYEIGLKGKKATAGRVSNTFGMRFDYATPLTFPAEVSAIGIRVYIPDVTQVSVIYVDIYNDSGFTVGTAWSRNTSTIAKPLVNGWNTLRWRAAEGVRGTAWGSIYRLQVNGLSGASAGATFTVGHVWAEYPAKASILFIQDGPYSGGCQAHIRDLIPRGIPSTLAIDPPYIGQVTGGKQRATQAEIDAVLADGISSGSVHLATNGGDTNTMTAAQLRADIMAGIKYTQARGYSGGVWRAAWLGNNAPQAATVAPELLLASATYSSASAGPTCWPPVDRYKIPRWRYDVTQNNAALDAQFTELQNSHQTLLLYIHNVATPAGDTFDITDAQWTYLLSKLDAGITAGWLECVTFEQLYRRGGGRYRAGMWGGMVADFYDETGTLTTKKLP